MSDEPSAHLRASPALPAPDEYDTICAVLMDTERGRWFLQEYARRSRSADTQLLLAAIQRIESVVRAERSSQARQAFRSDLLEMAKAITRTRAEIDEMKPASRPMPPPSELVESGDIFATAERIRDVTWAMRGHGFDPSTCDQLEELAGSILSASSLNDPTDRRARKLSEVLHYLEHRIDAMLERCTDGTAAGREADPGPLEPPAGPDPSPWSIWPPAEPARAPTVEALILRPQPSISLLGRSVEPADPAPATPPPFATDARAAAEEARPLPASDPLAPLKAMSEVERLALFT